MKKLFAASLLLGTALLTVPMIDARAAAPTAEPSAQSMQNRYWRNRRVRTVVRTRITRVGRYRYRETVRTTYYPNGRTRTVVTNRVRLAGRNL